MPIRPPALDDRNFDSLVSELIARIPAHTPEWTNPRIGDPGRTMIELFSWLGETLLYRANLIPERQRLAFLRLLGVGMRPAVPARGLVCLNIKEPKTADAIDAPAFSTISKPTIFETRTPISIVPVTGELYCKRKLTRDEEKEQADVIEGLKQVYRITKKVKPYATTPVFPNGQPDPAGFDLIDNSIDHCLWIALLAPKKELVDSVRTTLGTTDTGGSRLLNVGIMPTIEVPALFEEIGPRARIPHLWEICRLLPDGTPDYVALDVIEDTSQGLTQRGVLRIALPNKSLIQAPTNNVRLLPTAGVGDSPPRLDDPDKDARLVTWLRLRPQPNVPLSSLRLSWVGINAVEVDGRQTIRSRVLGVSSGGADQEFALPGGSVESDTLVIEVEEDRIGYALWAQIDDLAIAGRDSAVYTLDSEAGTIKFGDGLRGRIPSAGRRVRVTFARLGGGEAGNLPANSLDGFSIAGSNNGDKIKIAQNLPTDGGQDAETLEEAEARIPALFRHKDRAITGDDYERLAADTPGVRLGRVEVLPKFRPFQRQTGVPGVVSVMVLPFKDGTTAPSPRPDRPMLEAVHGYLDSRRPIATELYVIGCEYVPLGVSVGLTVRAGFNAEEGTVLSQDSVLVSVRDALRRYLWALAPGGIDEEGWELGRSVRDRELEVIVARVPGVNTVARVNLFRWQNDRWNILPRVSPDAPVELRLEAWQLPELLSVVVVADADAPTDLRGVPNPFAGDLVAIPVVPKVC